MELFAIFALLAVAVYVLNDIRISVRQMAAWVREKQTEEAEVRETLKPYAGIDYAPPKE